MNNVEKIKGRLNIEDVVGAYVKLEAAGSNLRARCPFHNEKTPSFFVSPDRGTYKCFGCGEGGDIFSFVEKFEGVDFMGALKILADKAGVELKKENPKITDERNQLYSVLEKTTVFFEEQLKANSEALKYLKNRGVEDETIRQFRLGFAKDEWRGLSDFLKRNNFGEDEIEKAGLIKKTNKGCYDRFRSRIIFPLFDNSGRPVAFSGRFFGEEKQSDQHTAKYLNSPETPLFSKSNILYGYNFAKSQIRKKDFSILVEGQMDLIMCHQAGYGNAVASSGTALSTGHLKLLKRLSNRTVIAFDGDEAGFASACRATKLALSEGLEVRLMKIPENLDPADFILTDLAGWQKSLKNAKHIIGFYLEKLLDEIGQGVSIQKMTNEIKRKLGQAVQKKVLPFVSLINSEIEKATFVEDIANKLDISDKAIWTELDKMQADLTRDENTAFRRNERLTPKHSLTNQNAKSPRQNILKRLAGIYWWQKGIKNSALNMAKFEKELSQTAGEVILEKVLKLEDKIKDGLIFETEILYENSDLDDDETENIKTKVKELFVNLKIALLDEEMATAMEEQVKAEKSGDTDEVAKKLKACNDLSKKKNDLVTSNYLCQK